jgi:hypothetical protein
LEQVAYFEFERLAALTGICTKGGKVEAMSKEVQALAIGKHRTAAGAN